MKHMTKILLYLLLFSILGACGNETGINDDDQVISNEANEMQGDESGNQRQQDNTQEQQNHDNDFRLKMDELNFRSFDLDIEYAGGQKFEVDLDEDDDDENDIEAEVSDGVRETYLVGKDAFEYIYERVSRLSLDETSSKENVIHEVLESFDMADDYAEFEIEIEFKNGSKLDVEDRK